MNVSALRSLFGESNAAISGSVVAKSLMPFSTRLLVHTGHESSPTLRFLTSQRYSVLYDLMFEAEYVQKDVDDDVIASDRELGEAYSDYILGKKFSPVYNIEEGYQEYLIEKSEN